MRRGTSARNRSCALFGGAGLSRASFVLAERRIIIENRTPPTEKRMDTVTVSAGPIPKSLSLRESARQVLLAQIMSGEIIAGEIHSVSKVAEALGISPTPVREAVLDLADKGLVVIHKNRGFIAPVVTRAEVQELHFIRSLLEIPATVRAGMLVPAARKDELYGLANDTIGAASAGDLVRYIDLDRRFHSVFLEPLSMPQLVRLIMTYRDRSRLRGLRARLGTSEIISAAHEHVELVDAAVARNRRELTKVITKHLEGTLRRAMNDERT